MRTVLVLALICAAVVAVAELDHRRRLRRRHARALARHCACAERRRD